MHRKTAMTGKIGESIHHGTHSSELGDYIIRIKALLMAQGACLQNFEVNFVDESVSIDWSCPICLELLSKPFLTECCRHHFCNKCINSAKQRKDECPLCKASPVKGGIDKPFSKELYDTQVSCSFKDSGCEWRGRLCNLKNHLSLGQQHGQCKHVIVKCPNKCKMMMLRKDTKRHTNNECNRRSFICPYCNHKGVYADVVTNHYPKCPHYPITCPNNCEKNEMKRNELPNHLQTCPNTIVSCPYNDVGCKVTMKRCDVKSHVESSVGIGQHQEMLFRVVSGLEKNNKSWNKDLNLRYQELSSQLESQVAVLKDKCDQMEHQFFSSLHLCQESEVEKEKLIGELCDTNKKLESNLSSLHVKQSQLEDELQITRKENEEMKVTIKCLQVRCGDLENRFSKVKFQLLSSSQAMIKDQMKCLYDEMMVEMRELIQNQAVGCTSDSVLTSNVDELSDEQSSECEDEVVTRENELLENGLSTLQSTCSAIENRLGVLESQFKTCKEEVTAAKVYVGDQLNGLNTIVTNLQANSPVSSEQHQNVESWIHGYKLTADRMKKKNWKLYLKTMSETATQFPDSTSPIIVQVCGYEKAKMDGTVLVTSPFYTAGAGKYKFELHICITAYIVPGYVDSANTYMSVHASLLEGEHDDLLMWPFIGSISVTLLNQIENNNHFTKQIWRPREPSEVEYTERVRRGRYRNQSWGQIGFISHSELENVTVLKQFVVNDCMYFRVDASAARHPVNCSNCILH